MASDQPKQEGQLVEQMALEIDGLESQSRSLDELMAECREELSVARQTTQGVEQTLESARGQAQELRQQAAICRPFKMPRWAAMCPKRRTGCGQ